MPTQKPDNEIIRIAESTVNLPSTGKVNKQVPSYDLRTVGYDKNKRIFAEELNYTLDNIGQWCQWFENRVDELQTTAEGLQTELDQAKIDFQEELDRTESDLLDQIEKERVSIGELIEITGDSTNPSILKGYGTWEYFGEGLTTVGVGTHTDDRGEEITFTEGTVFGEYKHVQSVDEVATHAHGTVVSSDSHTHDVTTNSDSNTVGGGISASRDTDTDQIASGKLSTHQHRHTVTVENTGNSSPMNNIQPSVAVYRWKRTS